MKMLLGVVAVAAALAWTPKAHAQVSLDVKAGYALPSGNIQKASPLVSDDWPMTAAWSGALPLGLSARYRFTPNVSAGIYFQWSPGFSSGHDARAGIELVYGFTPDEALNPWFSLGFGWEWSQWTMAAAGATSTVNVSGWELPVVQTGLDFSLSRVFALGPYVGLFGGTYTNLSYSATASRWAVDPATRSFHVWWQFGAKGTLNL